MGMAGVTISWLLQLLRVKVCADVSIHVAKPFDLTLGQGLIGWILIWGCQLFDYWTSLAPATLLSCDKIYGQFYVDVSCVC
jgi:hypothetical protein